MSTKSKSNPALHRQLLEPFVDRKAASTAADAFFDELYALRVKHGIADLYVIMALRFKEGEDERETMVPTSIGDTRRAAEFAAFAYGFEQANSAAWIEKVAAIGKQAGKSNG